MNIFHFFLWSLLKTAVVTVILLMGVAYTVLLEPQAGGPHPESLGTEPRGPVRSAATAGRWREILPSRKTSSPPAAYKLLYLLAPILSLGCALISIAVVPFGEPDVGPAGIHLFQISDVNIGLLVILGVTSIGVYGIALSGWASNNKYSLLGVSALLGTAHQLRARAGSVAGWRGTPHRFAQPVREIVQHQSIHGLLSWNFFGGFQFVAFFIYLTAWPMPMTNRSPV